VFFLSSAEGALAADLGKFSGLDSAPMAADLGEWIRGDTSGLGAVPFVAAHVLAIVLCFPGAAIFELTAGAVFGFLPGVVAVASAKGIAASVTFFIARAASEGPLGRWIQDRLDGEGQGWADKLQRGVQRDAFKFSLLARLSPAPSWVSNYGLPLAGVPLGSFLPATLVGMLPPLASNVYSGAAAASLAAALGGGGVPSLDWAGVLLGALSALSGAAVVQQLAALALESDAREERG